MARQPDDFLRQAIAKGIERWPLHRCSMCGYEVAYLFNWADTAVAFDPGCYCSNQPFEPRDWSDVADHYNMQKHPGVIAKYDAFWGFGSSDSETGDTK